MIRFHDLGPGPKCLNLTMRCPRHALSSTAWPHPRCEARKKRKKVRGSRSAKRPWPRAGRVIKP
eukprot:5759594-Pleurochrysis_carterae.AAC.1